MKMSKDDLDGAALPMDEATGKLDLKKEIIR